MCHWCTSEAQLEVENGEEEVRWYLSSFAPPYVKVLLSLLSFSFVKSSLLLISLGSHHYFSFGNCCFDFDFVACFKFVLTWTELYLNSDLFHDSLWLCVYFLGSRSWCSLFPASVQSFFGIEHLCCCVLPVCDSSHGSCFIVFHDTLWSALSLLRGLTTQVMCTGPPTLPSDAPESLALWEPGRRCRYIKTNLIDLFRGSNCEKSEMIHTVKPPISALS